MASSKTVSYTHLDVYKRQEGDDLAQQRAGRGGVQPGRAGPGFLGAQHRAVRPDDFQQVAHVAQVGPSVAGAPVDRQRQVVAGDYAVVPGDDGCLLYTSRCV